MRLAHHALEAVLELVCPTRCAGCELPGTLLCGECLAALVIADSARACPRCGAPGGRDRCTECEGATFAFEAARAVGPLVRPLSRLVTVYKDGGERRLAGELGALLAASAGEWSTWAQAITWVPASRAAISRRGFDHAGLLAKVFGERARVSTQPLLCAARTRDQRGLGRQARRDNVSGSFAAIGGEPPARVLLVDDVFTTGATLDAAAGALHSAGCSNVRALVVGRKVADEQDSIAGAASSQPE